MVILFAVAAVIVFGVVTVVGFVVISLDVDAVIIAEAVLSVVLFALAAAIVDGVVSVLVFVIMLFAIVIDDLLNTGTHIAEVFKLPFTRHLTWIGY